MASVNVNALKRIGQDIACMIQDYSSTPYREMQIDLALYACLRETAKRGVERQFRATLPRRKRPARIDFRVVHPNAVLIEFAVRPRIGGGQLAGSQNKAELCKLTRFGNSKAKLRALLLIDLARKPYDLCTLKAQYDQIDAGRGRFPRNPVKVIYAHAQEAFAFKWDPYKART